MIPVKRVSEHTIGRLSRYRRLLADLLGAGVTSVYSHELARLTGRTAAQIRRDLMAIGCSGSSKRGYHVDALVESIGRFLDDPAGRRLGLVGVGHLGRALIARVAGRRPNLALVAAFDRDPNLAGEVIHGCPCHPMAELARVVADERISVALLAVPAAEANKVAEQLVLSRIRGIVNFAPIHLQVGPEVHVEEVDLTMSLEKAVYFAAEPPAGKPAE